MSHCNQVSSYVGGYTAAYRTDTDKSLGSTSMIDLREAAVEYANDNPDADTETCIMAGRAAYDHDAQAALNAAALAWANQE